MFNQPHSIRILLLDGTPEGVRSAEIIMSTIEAIAFNRSLLSRVKSELDLARPGVYVLIGESTTNAETDNAKKIWYIGESEDLSQRLANHASNPDKDFWLETIIFTSKDDNLTKAHVRYVEAELIKIAQKNPFWLPFNKQEPSSEGKLPLADRVAMSEFIKQVCVLAGTLGLDVFKFFDNPTPAPSTSASASQTPQSQTPTVPDSPLFYLEGTGYSAIGKLSETTGEFIVLSGSKAKKEVAPSLAAGNKQIRQDLLSKQLLIDNLDFLLFTSDFPFSSPSAAASTVNGSPTNGRTAWRTKEGTTFADYSSKINQ